MPRDATPKLVHDQIRLQRRAFAILLELLASVEPSRAPRSDLDDKAWRRGDHRGSARRLADDAHIRVVNRHVARLDLEVAGIDATRAFPRGRMQMRDDVCGDLAMRSCAARHRV